jgi:flagellin-specific chaperone FliS
VIEVERLVRELRDAWAEMLCKQDTPQAEQVRVVA